MTHTIRLALEDDAAAVAGIYGPFCESTAVSFEYAAPSMEEIANRIRTVTAQFPWLVLDDSGVVAAYAYATGHRERAAYGWSVDVAVYVSPVHRRRGAGRALYTTMFHLLRLQGYFKAYAGITLPNNGSIGLHEAVGFTLVGVYRGVGYKHGVWHDVAWYQIALKSERLNPDPPVPVSALAESPGWAEAVSQGLGHYRPATASPSE
ncbi:MAG: N-acetyltransferase family protein [Vicinamibacterales bacterium]